MAVSVEFSYQMLDCCMQQTLQTHDFALLPYLVRYENDSEYV
jgi:hypothetical protein